MRTHPYAEALYEVVALATGHFGVKVSTSEANPAIVSHFETVAAAEAWIAAHKSRVEVQSQSGKRFGRPARRATADA